MNNSTVHHLSQLRPYIIALMRQDKRNFRACELCAKPTKGNYEIHHTKYEGATYKDLLIVCRSCNRIGENVGLA